MIFTCRKQDLIWSLMFAVSLAVLPLVNAASVLAASSNAAEVENHIPWGLTLTSCSGDLVTIVGDMRTLSHIHDDGTGAFHGHISGAQDGSGVGVSGAVYQFSNSFSLNVNGSASPSVLSIEMSSHLNTSGPDNNTDMHTTVHLTINANGDVTVVNVDTRGGCQ